MAIKDNILILATRPQIGPLTFNCNISVMHGGDFAVTQMPIEDGSVLTDHKIQLPLRLQIETILSQYPDNIVDQFRGESGRAKRNWDDSRKTGFARIRALAESMEPFQVVTDYQVYDNMTIESFSAPETSEDAIRVSFSLVQVQVANVGKRKSLAESFEDMGETPDNLGLQDAVPL